MISFKQHITEKWMAEIKKMGANEFVPVFVNPTKKEFAELTKAETSGLYELRFIVGDDGKGNIYMFTHQAFHSSAEKASKPKIKNAVYGIYEIKKNVVLLLQDDDPEMPDIMKSMRKNKNFKAVLPTGWKVKMEK